MSTPLASNVARFGDFVVDLRTGELLKNGTKIRLQVQPFQVLVLLLRRPGEMVTREELREKLWPGDTFVDFDDGLNTAVRKLRQVLGDSPEHPKYIETLPRRGYRFIGSLDNTSISQAEPTPGVSERVIEGQSSAASENVVTEVPAVSRAHSRWMLWASAAALAGLLVLLVGLDAGGWRERVLARATPVHIHSIAVLPLENLSGDPAQEYFADGMTEAVITDLGKVAELRVISRTSAMHYKGTRKTLPEIARELSVDAVVEGAVLRSGNRVRITAQLVEASSDRHLWAESYERDLADVLALQGQVAQAIVREIEIKLTPQQKAGLARTRPINPDAYEAYLKGRYYLDKRTRETYMKSREYFEQAIRLDPNYAPAYAGLADFYDDPYDGSGEMAIGQVIPKEREAAAKALEIDETSAEAHSSMAFVRLWYDWDWPGAEKEFRRAIELNPSLANTHYWYARYLSFMGRLDEAIAEIQQARKLDPLSVRISWATGDVLCDAGQTDEAIEQERKTIELDPNFPPAHNALGKAYKRKSMFPEAVAEFEKEMILGGGLLNAESVAKLRRAYATAGISGYWRKRLELLKKLSKRRYVDPATIARAYADLGENNEALNWLELAYKERSHGMVTFLLKLDQHDSLRSDPRFVDLLRRMGFPP